MQSYIDEIAAIMETEGLNRIVIDTFRAYYRQVEKGATGKLSSKEIYPPSDENVERYESLTHQDGTYLEKLVYVKLNGGLGTSMGLKKAKSLLPVKNGLTFLDIIARQVLHLRDATGKAIPLLFMNSFNTHDDTLEHLLRYKNLSLGNLPIDFVQNKFPKLIRENLAPLKCEDDVQNWNPPGHGDIYMAMAISGILDRLIEMGYLYMFVSNADNLGAVVDEKILTWFAENDIPFAMEVCRRLDIDKKGGHLAQDKDGQLLLREAAQCPENEVDEFQDTDVYRWFNTNNLWINLEALRRKLDENDNVMILPLILNAKVVDDVPVYQIETAMGAAIGVFNGSKAIAVPRHRFAPVKKTTDLLVVWSDAYKLDEQYRVVPVGESIPSVKLDDRYYKDIDGLVKHFEEGVPSLRECRKLEIEGEIIFGKNVVIKGSAKLKAAQPTRLQDITID